MPTQEMKDELRRFGNAIYKNGYEEGYAGKPYSGKTFIGYYGWLDGRDKRERCEP